MNNTIFKPMKQGGSSSAPVTIRSTSKTNTVRFDEDSCTSLGVKHHDRVSFRMIDDFLCVAKSLDVTDFLVYKRHGSNVKHLIMSAKTLSKFHGDYTLKPKGVVDGMFFYILAAYDVLAS